jgi:5-methylcytosine-specific restriction endonuclease McrA
MGGWNKGLTKETDNRVRKMYSEGKEKICPICKSTFYCRKSEINKKKTCSKKCGYKYKSLSMRGKIPKNINQIKGWNKGIKNGKNINCSYCNKSIYVIKSEYDRNKTKKFFCSPKHSRLYFSGKNHWTSEKGHSKYSKKKIGEMSKKMWEEKGFINNRFEKTHPNTSIKEIVRLYEVDNMTLKTITKKTGVSRRTLKRILEENGIDVGKNQRKISSESRTEQWKDEIYRKKREKEMNQLYNIWRDNPKKHPAWLGGISFEPYDPNFNKRFKNLIRKRDNQICMLCGIHREKLERALAVHHINYDKKLSIPENCISLCINCHMKTNGNRKHWIKFFQSLLSEKYNYQYEDNLPIINLEVKNVK